MQVNPLWPERQAFDRFGAYAPIVMGSGLTPNSIALICIHALSPWLQPAKRGA